MKVLRKEEADQRKRERKRGVRNDKKEIYNAAINERKFLPKGVLSCQKFRTVALKCVVNDIWKNGRADEVL